MLPRPSRWQVGEASNAHAVGEPAIDGRFDEIGGEESQRDCHVDLSRAAVLPLGDAVGICCWISDEFTEPTAATGNRCHQSRTRFRTYWVRMVRADPLGQKNLAAPSCRRLLPRDMESAIESRLLAICVSFSVPRQAG